MKKVIVMMCLVIFAYADTNIMLASKINAVMLNYANELFNSSKLKANAKEHYLENIDKYAKNLKLFYDEYAIAVTELKQELTFFCLLPHKFKSYDKSLGTVERQDVCKPVYRNYGVRHGDIDQDTIQSGEDVLAEYIRIGKMTNEEKLYEYSVQDERENLVRLVSPKDLKNASGIVDGMFNPDKIK